MNTLAKELEDLETRRASGSISDADAALAKQALLSRASAAPDAPRQSKPNRGLFGWIIAGVFANLMVSLLVLSGVSAIAFWLLPMAMALPILICAVFILPLLWLLEWIGDLF